MKSPLAKNTCLSLALCVLLASCGGNKSTHTAGSSDGAKATPIDIKGQMRAQSWCSAIKSVDGFQLVRRLTLSDKTLNVEFLKLANDSKVVVYSEATSREWDLSGKGMRLELVKEIEKVSALPQASIQSDLAADILAKNKGIAEKKPEAERRFSPTLALIARYNNPIDEQEDTYFPCSAYSLDSIEYVITTVTEHGTVSKAGVIQRPMVELNLMVYQNFFNSPLLLPSKPNFVRAMALEFPVDEIPLEPSQGNGIPDEIVSTQWCSWTPSADGVRMLSFNSVQYFDTRFGGSNYGQKTSANSLSSSLDTTYSAKISKGRIAGTRPLTANLDTESLFTLVVDTHQRRALIELAPYSPDNTSITLSHIFFDCKDPKVTPHLAPSFVKKWKPILDAQKAKASVI